MVIERKQEENPAYIIFHETILFSLRMYEKMQVNKYWLLYGVISI